MELKDWQQVWQIASQDNQMNKFIYPSASILTYTLYLQIEFPVNLF